MKEKVKGMVTGKITHKNKMRLNWIKFNVNFDLLWSPGIISSKMVGRIKSPPSNRCRQFLPNTCVFSVYVSDIIHIAHNSPS